MIETLPTLMRQLAAGLLAAGLLSNTDLAQAGPTRLLLESKVDGPAGAELYQVTYASSADFRANNLGESGFLPQDIASNFSVAEIAYERGRYHMLLEANSNRPGGSEVFLMTYASWADLQANNLAAAQFLPLDIASGFSVHGFTYDGRSFRLLLESDLDSNGGAELFLASFDSYEDLLGNWASSGQFLRQDISPDFSVAGLAFNDGVYQLLLETDEAAGAAGQLFLASYDSFADLLSNSPSEQALLQQTINSRFAVRGFEFEASPVAGPGSGSNPASLPEPASWALVLVSLASSGAVVRRRVRRYGHETPPSGSAATSRRP